MLDLHLNHYCSSPFDVAQSIRQCLQILGNYNTLQPQPVHVIFMKIRGKINTLDDSGVEKEISQQHHLYLERQVNIYHIKLERYTTALRDVLEMSDTELNAMTHFTKTPDSQDWSTLEWQNQARILLDLRSKFLTSSFRDGKLCYPSLPKPRGLHTTEEVAGQDGQEVRMQYLLAQLHRQH